MKPLHAYCDGSGNSPRGSTCACVIVDPETAEVLLDRSKVLKKCSNNVAEYEGLILALETAHELGVRDLEVFSDSQLIVNQVNEKWDVKHWDLLELRGRAWVAGSFIEDSLKLTWIPREQNTYADKLCRDLLDQTFPKRATKALPRPDLNEIASR